MHQHKSVSQFKGLFGTAHPFFARVCWKFKSYRPIKKWRQKRELLLDLKACTKRLYRMSFVGQTALYYKINVLCDWSLRCIRNWIEVARELDYCCIFVVDNPFLFERVRSMLGSSYGDEHFYFMQSSTKETRKYSASFSITKRWRRATCAQLTPFFHAERASIESFWSIDADDTAFLLPKEKIVGIIKTVEEKTRSGNYAGLSLDMWCSCNNGNNWTFGVSFFSRPKDFARIFRQKRRVVDWMELTPTRAANLDAFMYYLKERNAAELATFYVENASFVHWGYPGFCSICRWSHGRLEYPLLNATLMQAAHSYAIPKDLVMVTVDL